MISVFTKIAKVVLVMVMTGRIALSVLAILFTAGLFASAGSAETMAAYSGKYILDMEQKQALLDSIREDAAQAEAELRDDADKVGDAGKRKSSRLGSDAIDLTELMPPTGRINIAFTATHNMLSPESGVRNLKEGKDRTRQ